MVIMNFCRGKLVQLCNGLSVKYNETMLLK
jgi:hypothetical protein